MQDLHTPHSPRIIAHDMFFRELGETTVAEATTAVPTSPAVESHSWHVGSEHGAGVGKPPYRVGRSLPTAAIVETGDGLPAANLAVQGG